MLQKMSLLERLASREGIDSAALSSISTNPVPTAHDVPKKRTKSTNIVTATQPSKKAKRAEPKQLCEAQADTPKRAPVAEVRYACSERAVLHRLPFAGRRRGGGRDAG